MELIKIAESEISGAVVQTVNARDLHAFLESRAQFADWIKQRVEQYDFAENRDFVIASEFSEANGRGGQNRKDYFLSLDMAKELSMVERNAKGKEARQYFIECERRAKAAPALDVRNPATLTTIAIQLIEVNKELEARAIAAEKVAIEAKEDVNALARIAKADGSLCLRESAKALQLREKDLIAYLMQHKWIFRNHNSGTLQGYAARVQSGDLEHKVTTVLRGDGTEKITEQVRITPQGLAKLAKLFPPLLSIAS